MRENDAARTMRRMVADYVGAMLRDPCCYCGQPSETIDHIIPTSRGGGSRWTNYAGVCGSCNSSKNASTPLGMLAWRIFAPERLVLERQLAQIRAFRRVGA